MTHAEREQFLRARGSFPQRQKREIALQRREIQVAADWLIDHINRFRAQTDETSKALVHAWQKDLLEKRKLMLKLLQGKTISREEIRAGASIPEVIRKTRTQKREYAATTTK